MPYSVEQRRGLPIQDPSNSVSWLNEGRGTDDLHTDNIATTYDNRIQSIIMRIKADDVPMFTAAVFDEGHTMLDSRSSDPRCVNSVSWLNEWYR